tara:strand:+ start:205 stop:534 length:330 start_codon:yes stop_codon:yes gene_type:complete
MSIINKIMSKQNNVFILFKKDIEQDNDKEILGVYSSHDIALSEKQKYSIKYTIDKLNIEGPFIINKNVLSPPGPPPISTPNFKNLESLPRFNPIYPNITQMLMNYNSIY